jgi:hypothetical protein
MACRLHSLLPEAALEYSSSLSDDILGFLSLLREVLQDWLQRVNDAYQKLKDTAKNSESQSAKTKTAQRLIHISAVIRSTFHVDPDTLTQVLETGENLALFLKCGFLIQKYSPAKTDHLPMELRLIVERDDTRTAINLPIIRRLSKSVKSGLSSAIQMLWSKFATERHWEDIESKPEYIFTSTPCDTDKQSIYVHVNLRDGQLLFNGKPLGILPRSITRSITYDTLFPDSVRNYLTGLVITLIDP